MDQELTHNVARDLSNRQLSALALAYFFRCSNNFGIGRHDMLGKYLDKHVAPHIYEASNEDKCYINMSEIGCGLIDSYVVPLENIFASNYGGQFQKGFSSNEIIDRNISIGYDHRFLIPCFNDATRLQVRASSNETLAHAFDIHRVPDYDRIQIFSLFNKTMMNEVEIRYTCIKIRPYMRELFLLWSESIISRFSLTPMGRKIAQDYLNREVITALA